MAFPDLVPKRSTMTLASDAVRVTGAYKSYGKGPHVLKNLSMQVEKGTIYGLLGSSGCGKTTLLSCIMGLQNVDSGEVKVSGYKPGTEGIGYMPQDIALYEVLSIKEILSYYGQIYGMSHPDIKKRIEFLTSFLALPDASRHIKTLSGGQKRRVSLAVAMVNQPPILVLDEPTVGIDPILRYDIWEHLCEIVSLQGITVIITSHYVEELIESHRVGIMRGGRLICETNPNELLSEHQTDLLGDVVLKLCRNDSSNQLDDKAPDVDLSQIFIDSIKRKEDEVLATKVIGLKYKPRCSETYYSAEESFPQDGGNSKSRNVLKTVTKQAMTEYNKMASLLKRNFLLHFRQPVFVLVQFMLPIIQIMVFNYVLNSEPRGLKMGVVNNEIPINYETGESFLQYCEKRGSDNGCFGPGLSCVYFSMFDKNQINWIPTLNEEEALKNVQMGEMTGYISIPKDFGATTQQKFLHRNFATNDSLIGSAIGIRLDLSNKLNSNYLTKELYQRYLLFVQEVAEQCGMDPQLVALPLKEDPVYGSINSEWAEFFQPAIILWIMFLVPTGIGVICVQDVREGTLDRTRCAGIKFRHILTSILICEMGITGIQLALCLGVSVYGFGFKVVGSFYLLAFFSFLMGMVGVTSGLLVGIICYHEMEVIMSVSTIYITTVTLSGGLWPIEAIVPWFRIFSYFGPITLPLVALRAVTSKGWGLEHQEVQTGLVFMLGWIFVSCLLNGIIYRLKR